MKIKVAPLFACMFLIGCGSDEDYYGCGGSTSYSVAVNSLAIQVHQINLTDEATQSVWPWDSSGDYTLQSSLQPYELVISMGALFDVTEQAAAQAASWSFFKKAYACTPVNPSTTNNIAQIEVYQVDQDNNRVEVNDQFVVVSGDYYKSYAAPNGFALKRTDIEVWNARDPARIYVNYSGGAYNVANIAYKQPESIAAGEYKYSIQATMVDGTQYTLTTQMFSIEPYDQGAKTPEYVSVYKPQNAIQCVASGIPDEFAGLDPLDLGWNPAVASEEILTNVDNMSIDVLKSVCAVDTTGGKASDCGPADTNIVVHRVKADDLEKVNTYGYQSTVHIHHNYTEYLCESYDGEKEVEPVEPETHVGLLDAQIKKVIASNQYCELDLECKSIGFGAKPCGGPVEYLTYSNRALYNVEKKAFAEQVATYNTLQASNNAESGLVSDCAIVMASALSCSDNQCKAQ